MLAHLARVPEGKAGALSAEIARTWGTKLRAEVGLRAVGVAIRDIDATMTPMKYGIGAGAFVGLGVGTAIGTIYVRGGADFMTFSNDNVSATPNGALGLELPL